MLCARDKLNADSRQVPLPGIEEPNGPTYCYTWYVLYLPLLTEKYILRFGIFLTLWSSFFSRFDVVADDTLPCPGRWCAKQSYPRLISFRNRREKIIRKSSLGHLSTDMRFAFLMGKKTKNEGKRYYVENKQTLEAKVWETRGRGRTPNGCHHTRCHRDGGGHLSSGLDAAGSESCLAKATSLQKMLARSGRKTVFLHYVPKCMDDLVIDINIKTDVTFPHDLMPGTFGMCVRACSQQYDKHLEQSLMHVVGDATLAKTQAQLHAGNALLS